MIEYYNELTYYIQRMIGDKEKAKDIVQEAYVKVIAKSKKIDIKNERAFLYRVSRNIVIDEYRKNSRIKNIEYNDDVHFLSLEDNQNEVIPENDKEKILRESLIGLPKRLAEVFTLYIFYGYSKKQISDILNIKENTVQKYIIHAKERLSECINM